MERVRELDTDAGPARVYVTAASGTPAFLLVYTHGAGGGVDAPDLLALRAAAHAAGAATVAVEQPFRVAGRRMPGANTERQDTAWVQIVTRVRAELPRAPLVLAGRSNGARVACRTAARLGAAAVVTLAFPVHPPGRPERSRAAELRDAAVPVVAVSGDRDPFGVPEPTDVAVLDVRPGERHELAKNPAGAAEAALYGLRWVLDLVAR